MCSHPHNHKPIAGHILFVDDEEDVRTVVSLLLQQQGYQVSVYSDESFMEDIDKLVLPDLFLLDRRLANTDALGICYLLKAHQRTRHIPVIMLSADPTIQDLYKDAGADDFIGKPFDIKIFLEKIASFLPVDSGIKQ